MIKKIILSIFSIVLFSTSYAAEKSEVASVSWQLMSLAEIKARMNKGLETPIDVKAAVDYAKFFSPIDGADFSEDATNEIKLAQRKDEIIEAMNERIENFVGVQSLVVFLSGDPKPFHDYDLEKEAFTLEPMRKNSTIQSKNGALIDRKKIKGESGFFSDKVSGLIKNHEFVDYLPVDMEKASSVIDESNIRFFNMQYILYPIDYDGERVHYEIVGYRATGRSTGLYENKVVGMKLNLPRITELGLDSEKINNLIESQEKI